MVVYLLIFHGYPNLDLFISVWYRFVDFGWSEIREREKWEIEKWEIENERDGGDSVRQGKFSETENRDLEKMRIHGIRIGKIKRSAGELERRDGRLNI